MSRKRKRSFINRKAIVEVDHRFKLAESGSFVVTVNIPNDDNPDIAPYENCEVLSVKPNPHAAMISVEVRVADINKPFKLLKMVDVPGAHQSTERERTVHTFVMDGLTPREV